MCQPFLCCHTAHRLLCHLVLSSCETPYLVLVGSQASGASDVLAVPACSDPASGTPSVGWSSVS